MQVILKKCQSSANLISTYELFTSSVEESEERLNLRLIFLDDEYAECDLTLVHEFSEVPSAPSDASDLKDEKITVSSRILADGEVLNDFVVVEKVPLAKGGQELKRQAYLLLSRLTGIEMPFGSLIGVRPGEFVRRLLIENPKEEQVAEDLVLNYGLAPEKARKLLRVVQTEESLLEQLPQDAYLLYIGIPYCPGRCAYCSFIAQDALRHEQELHDYALALKTEIEASLSSMKPKISAVYFGGGTPTSLNTADLSLVLEALQPYLSSNAKLELTIEAGRADTLSREKLQLMKDFSVDRLCINPQSFHEETLLRIGRRHTVKQVYEMYSLARDLGFEDINMDLILGLPGESPKDFAYSLKEAIRLGVDSLTLHSLAFKRSAQIASEENISKHRRLLLPQSEWIHQLSEAENELLALDYVPYYLYRQKRVISGLENTGFAKAGKACLYNVGMMSDRREVIGIGSGSVSKRLRNKHLERIYNSKDLGQYICQINEVIAKKLKFFEEH